MRVQEVLISVRRGAPFAGNLECCIEGRLQLTAQNFCGSRRRKETGFAAAVRKDMGFAAAVRKDMGFAAEEARHLFIAWVKNFVGFVRGGKLRHICFAVLLVIVRRICGGTFVEQEILQHRVHISLSAVG